MLHVKVSRGGGRVVVSLAGELDCVEEVRCIKVLQSMRVELHTKLILDLSGITFMDSTGIKLLLLADRHARRNGLRRPIIRGAAPRVMRVLDSAGVTPLLNIEASRSEGSIGSAEHPSLWGNRVATP